MSTAVRRCNTSQAAKQAASTCHGARCATGEAGRLRLIMGDSESGAGPITTALGELGQVRALQYRAAMPCQYRRLARPACATVHARRSWSGARARRGTSRAGCRRISARCKGRWGSANPRCPNTPVILTCVGGSCGGHRQTQWGGRRGHVSGWVAQAFRDVHVVMRAALWRLGAHVYGRSEVEVLNTDLRY